MNISPVRRSHVIVYGTAGLLTLIAVTVFFPQRISVGGNWGNAVQLTQCFGALSMVYLYITLLITPVYHVFPKLPFRDILIQARKAVGNSACLFGVLHTYFGYFSFGGLNGLAYFGPEYIQSIVLGLIAAGLLILLLITSADAVHALLGQYWKPVHRLVYAAGLLTLFHVFTVTTHLGIYEFPIVVTQFILLCFLFILESVRFGDYCRKRYPRIPHPAIRYGCMALSCSVLYWASFIRYHPH